MPEQALVYPGEIRAEQRTELMGWLGKNYVLGEGPGKGEVVQAEYGPHKGADDDDHPSEAYGLFPGGPDGRS